MGAVKAVERAARAELRALSAPLQSSVLARSLVDLARRLDAEPGDRAATMLVREIRLVTAELHQRAADAGTGEVEAFLASVSTPSFRGAAD